MLAFFRRFVSSPLGIVFFGLILLAFIVGLYEGRAALGGLNIGGSDTVATVGGTAITDVEMRRRVTNGLNAARQQRPDLDMATYVASGGLDEALNQSVDSRAMTEFGRLRGLVSSDRLVGSMLNQMAAFKSPTGAFDESLYHSLLARAKISEAEFRQQFRDEGVINMLQVPIRGAVKLPDGLVGPYAALLLETRRGLIATVPSAAFGNTPAPTDAELATFYSRNTARYALPERRIVRYATFERDRFKSDVRVSNDEIARFYQQNAASYAARESRGLTQLVIRTQVDAEKALAAVRGGQSVAAVAQSLGLSPLKIAPLDEKSFAQQTSAAVARAAFAAPPGGVAALVQSGLGYHIIKVDSVDAKAAQPLAAARPTIVAQLTEQKIDEAASTFVTQLEDEATKGATFDELAKKYGLTTIVTPAVTQSGLNPEAPDYKPAPEMALILRDAFRADPEEDPSVIQIGAGKSFALWKLDRVVAAAPRPLAAIRDQVRADAQQDAAVRATRKTADAIAANVNRGMSLAQAMAGAGIALPPPSPAGGRRIDMTRVERVQPPLALLFSMTQKKAKALEIADSKGYYVVYLDSIVPGDARTEPGIIDQTRVGLSRLAADEYLGQFVTAVKAEIGTTRNPAAVATLRKALIGSPAAQ